MGTPRDVASDVFAVYKCAYGDSTQGCCLLIADEIQRSVGGEVVAGEIWWFGGSCRRPHWWVVVDGEVLDPMGDDVLSHEEYTGRTEIHRDRSEFDAILPRYEQWRVEARHDH